MKNRSIIFFTPPAERRVGGLDTALKGWIGALQNKEIDVRVNPNSELKNADIIHFHGLWEPSYSKPFSLGLSQGNRILFSPHGMLEPWAYRQKWWKKIPFFHLIEKGRLLRSTFVLATSKMEARNLRQRIPRTNVKILPLGLADEPGDVIPSNRRTDTLHLLYLSRVDRKKGLIHLLHALRDTRLSLWKTRLTLTIVGEGDPGYLAECRQLAKAHAHELPQIEWTGAVWGKERWRYFYASDLFCLPTYSENFGLAVLEAMRAGSPVLVGRDTPWTDFAPPPPFFTCEPTVESVVRSLLEALPQFPVSAENRTQRTTWTRKNFSWDKITDDYLALME